MTIPYIPYFQTSRYRVAAMIELAKIRPGEKAVDLGSGDGRIVIALSKAGAIATGYELDEKLVHISRKNIHSATLRNEVTAGDSLAQMTDPVILKKDFWQEDLSHYSIICSYPMPTIMGRLEKKLQTELHPGSRVLLNYFPFLHWKEVARKDNVFLYER